MASPLNPLGAVAKFIANDGAFVYNPLLSDGDDVTSITVPWEMGTHAPPAGQIVRRGQIMHYDAATSKAWLPAAVADANAVLAQDIDLAATPTLPVQLYLSGKFKADALIYPAALAAAAVNDALRISGCLVESVMKQTGQTVRSGTTFTGTMIKGDPADPDEAAAEEKTLADAEEKLQAAERDRAEATEREAQREQEAREGR